MGWRLEAAGDRYFHDGHGGLQQQLARAAQAHVEVVFGGHLAYVALEQALDLAPRHTNQRRDLVQRQRLLDIRFHERGGLDQVLVKQAHAGLQRNVLAVLVVADAVEDELLGDQRRNMAPMVLLDDVQHQVQRRHAAGAGVAVAVDHKQLLGKSHARKLFTQRRHVFPMDDGLVFVQQAGLGQCVTTGAQGAQCDAALGQASQRAEQCRGNGLLNLDPTNHKNYIGRADGIERHRRRHRQAVAGHCRFTVQRGQCPLIGIALGQPVGHAQRIDGTGQRNHRVVGQRQKHEAVFRQLVDRVSRALVHRGGGWRVRLFSIDPQLR